MLTPHATKDAKVNLMTEERRILIESHPKWHDKMSAHMTLVQVRSKDVICNECGELIPEGSVAIRSAHRMSLHYFHIACGQKHLRIRS